MQCLATREAAEDVRNHVVRVEFRNIATDVLLAGVSQELEFSPIGPEDSAILCDPVQRKRRSDERTPFGSLATRLKPMFESRLRFRWSCRTLRLVGSRKSRRD